MRRLTSHIGIILLALLLSGWGEAFAAVLCPHAMAHDHGCCQEKVERAPTAKHHSGSHHQATQSVKPEHRAHASHHRGVEAVRSRAAETSCAHCVGQGDLPTAPASIRELIAQKSSAGKLLIQTTKILAQPATVPVSRFAPTQHAPPGPAGRTHLLLSVFLI